MKDKLREAVADLEAGVTTDAGYTVQNAVTDFLQKELKGRAKGTIDNYSCRTHPGKGRPPHAAGNHGG